MGSERVTDINPKKINELFNEVQDFLDKKNASMADAMMIGTMLQHWAAKQYFDDQMIKAFLRGDIQDLIK